MASSAAHFAFIFEINQPVVRYWFCSDGFPAAGVPQESPGVSRRVVAAFQQKVPVKVGEGMFEYRPAEWWSWGIEVGRHLSGPLQKRQRWQGARRCVHRR